MWIGRYGGWEAQWKQPETEILSKQVKNHNDHQAKQIDPKREELEKHTRGDRLDSCNSQNEQNNLAKTKLVVSQVLEEQLARLQK